MPLPGVSFRALSPTLSHAACSVSAREGPRCVMRGRRSHGGVRALVAHGRSRHLFVQSISKELRARIYPRRVETSNWNSHISQQFNEVLRPPRWLWAVLSG